MESTEEVDWFGNAGVGGPSLEDFLASDAAQLPFMNMEHGTFTGINEDRVCYQLFADTWESIDHLHEVNGTGGRDRIDSGGWVYNMGTGNCERELRNLKFPTLSSEVFEILKYVAMCCTVLCSVYLTAVQGVNVIVAHIVAIGRAGRK